MATHHFISSQGKERFLQILHRYMEVHGTVYYETQRPPEVPAFVKNHGLLPQHELQTLLRRAKVGRHLHLNTYPLKHMHRNVIGLSVSASDLVEVREYGEEKRGAHFC